MFLSHETSKGERGGKQTNATDIMGKRKLERGKEGGVAGQPGEEPCGGQNQIRTQSNDTRV